MFWFSVIIFLSGCQSGLVCVWRIPQDAVQTSVASSEGWWDQESNCQVNLLVFLKTLYETINDICFQSNPPLITEILYPKGQVPLGKHG